MKLLSTLKRFKREKTFLLGAYLVAIFSFFKNILLKKVITPEVFVEHLLALNLLAYMRYIHLGIPTVPTYENISLDKFKSSLISSSVIIGLPILLTLNFYLVSVEKLSSKLSLICSIFIITQISLNISIQKNKIWENYNGTGRLNLFQILNIILLIVSIILNSIIPSTIILIILSVKHIKLFETKISLEFLKRNGLKYVVLGIINQLLFSVIYFGLDYNFEKETTGDLFIIISIFNFTIILSNVFNEFVILKRLSINIPLIIHLLLVTFSSLFLLCVGIYIVELFGIISVKRIMTDFKPTDAILFLLFLIVWIIKNPIIDKALLLNSTSKFYLITSLITVSILSLARLDFRYITITVIAILTMNLIYLNYENNRCITTKE